MCLPKSISYPASLHFRYQIHKKDSNIPLGSKKHPPENENAKDLGQVTRTFQVPNYCSKYHKRAV